MASLLGTKGTGISNSNGQAFSLCSLKSGKEVILMTSYFFKKESQGESLKE
jgi:hypothetical protein